MKTVALLLAGLASTDGSLQEIAGKVIPYEHKQGFQQNHIGSSAFAIYDLKHQPGPSQFHPYTNTNEFPWVHTAGFKNHVPRFYYIPHGEAIRYKDTTGPRFDPFTKLKEHGDIERVIEWRYPVGTVFMEVLTTHQYPFEVRTRTKTKDGKWRANVYRPYQDADDLIVRLKELGTRDAIALANAIPVLPRKRVSVSDPHDIKSFGFDGFSEELPEIPEGLAKTILSWPFVSLAGWKEDCFAPTTKSSSLSFVSKDYEGFMVRPDSKGCAQCHDSTNRHAFFLQRNRDWYGRVRGSDGIFSFNIFSDESISPNFGEIRRVQFRSGIRLELDERRID